MRYWTSRNTQTNCRHQSFTQRTSSPHATHTDTSDNNTPHTPCLRHVASLRHNKGGRSITQTLLNTPCRRTPLIHALHPTRRPLGGAEQSSNGSHWPPPLPYDCRPRLCSRSVAACLTSLRLSHLFPQCCIPSPRLVLTVPALCHMPSSPHTSVVNRPQAEPSRSVLAVRFFA